MSTKGSDKKSKNDAMDTVSSADRRYDNGLSGGPVSSYRAQQKASNHLRFNSQNPNETVMYTQQRRRADFSVESASALNKRHLRESGSQLRGSAKNLQDLGSLRDSGGLEAALNDFSMNKKNHKRINGVQLAPLNHPTTLKSGVNILSQNRASIPMSSRQQASEAFHSSEKEKLTAAEMNSMALLQKEFINAGQISPHINSKNTLLNQLPVSCGLQKPHNALQPLQISKPSLMPLSSLNFTEKANRPPLDPISTAKKPKGISSTSRSGYTNDLGTSQSVKGTD